MNERDFDQLVASVKQAGAIKRDKMKPGRRIRMDPADIKMIRKKLNNFVLPKARSLRDR